MKSLFTFYCLIFCISSFSQAPNNQEKIKLLLDNYFLDDREIIHVQFSKSSYLNTEDIAFKGYVFSKNNNTPHFTTANIQVVIYNEKEEVVQKQLLLASNGVFTGGIQLNKKFKQGKYLFHFYTNWMNNFKEDDSFYKTIDIHEIDKPFYIKSKEPNLSTAKITFIPEGGVIIDGISNTIGVKITDCNNRGLELSNVLIFDSKSNEVSHFNTNKMGNGVLYLNAELNEKYTLKAKYNEISIAQDLPTVQQSGIAIGYNNNLPNNKLAISIKTNEAGVALNQNKKLNLLIQQNGYSVLKEINFNNQEKNQVVFIDKKYLQNGVNSLRLIDESLNEITERLIYYYADNPTTVTVNAIAIANDSIKLAGTTNFAKANLSISVLSDKNIGTSNGGSILGTFNLNTYLEQPEIDNFCYFDPENKNSKRDMDYLMQVQARSKLHWNNIKTNANPAVINYKFNKGVTLSGSIQGKGNPNANKTISLISIKNNVFEKIKVEKDNSFKLENYFVQDSTVYMLQLENEKNAAVFSKIVAQVSDNYSKFVLPIRFNKSKCIEEKNSVDSFLFTESKAKNTIDLEEVLIKAKKKEIFTHNQGMSPSAVAHKIDNRDFGTILDFIGRNGFRTGLNNNEAFITSNRNSSSSGSPEVFLDGVFLFDFNILFDLDIDSVDEVYIDKTGIASNRNNAEGSIKIFLKRGKENSSYISKSSTIIATNAFTKPIPFKNTTFNTQKEFDLMGTLNWSPKVSLTENQNFEIKFPINYQKIIEVKIEGFTDDGQLISEIKKIPITPL